MLFVLMGLDKPEPGAKIRRNIRVTHLRFVAKNQGHVPLWRRPARR
jgi:hypothetical protein